MLAYDKVVSVHTFVSESNRIISPVLSEFLSLAGMSYYQDN